jgi:predicted ABC-type ATPase
MFTTDVLKDAPFNLSELEILEFVSLAKRFDISLDGFLSGTVYSPTPYNEAQQTIIQQELQAIYELTFAGKTPGDAKNYTATAGAPGVGKSIFIEQLIASRPGLQAAVYVDPDRQALRFMNSYKQMSSEKGGAEAYETYRDASNYICNVLMLLAIYKGYSIVHGTTSTNDRVAKAILPQLKAEGYNIDIIVLFADADSRKESLLHRIKVQDFYQVTQADAKGKVASVYDRLIDAYLKYADTVTMYYNNDKFWLCTDADQSHECLQQFAEFNRARDPNKVIAAAGSDAILEKLIAEVYNEVSSIDKQEAIVAMFKSWPQEQTNSYFPTFSNVVSGVAAYFSNPRGGDAIKPSPKLQ